MAWSAVTLGLAACLGASLDLGVELRLEGRGADGGRPGVRISEPVPYEVAPTVTLAIGAADGVDGLLRVAPRFLLLAGDSPYSVRDTAANAEFSGQLRWRHGERLALAASGSFALGTTSTAPLAQLAGSTPASGPQIPGQPVPGQPVPGGADPAAGLRVAESLAWSLRGGGQWSFTPALTAGGAVGYGASGGVSASDRLVLPERSAADAEAFLAVAPTALDSTSLRTAASRTRVGATDHFTLVQLGARWDHRLSPSLVSSLSAGASATVEDSTAHPPTSILGRVAPTLSAGLAFTAIDGRGPGGVVTLGYSPYVDAYANAVRQRLFALGTLDFRLGTGVHLGTGLSAAADVDREATPAVFAADVTAGFLRQTTELGLLLRCGYQRAESPNPSFWQFGLAFVARWRERMGQ